MEGFPFRPKSNDKAKKKKAATKKEEGATAGEARYRHDVEQAMAMRSKPATATVASSSAVATAAEQQQQLKDDVQLTLRGLDLADGYREGGNLDEAMKLYGLGLELGIRVLRQTQGTGASSSSWDREGRGRGRGGTPPFDEVDRDSFESRVHAALSDAEEVKSLLKDRNNSGNSSSSTNEKKNPVTNGDRRIGTTTQQKQQSPSESSSETRSTTASSSYCYGMNYPSSLQAAYSSVSNALMSALQRQQQTTKASTTTMVTSLSASPKRTPQQQQQRSRVTTTSAPSATITTRQPSQQHGAASGSGLKPGDQLKQTVLDEFYVDRAELQRTGWDDICGLDGVKQSLQETAILPLMRPDLFGGLRKQQNVLLYGPPVSWWKHRSL